ncbi:MAG: hypothetical protein KDA60_02505 [Planctomycetales bacterium]|nr:hypothetical protein [Planctomycetales bacterium]
MTTSTETTPRPSQRGRTAWAVQQAFASIFTPSWSLGLILSFSFLLPTARGCNDKTIYVTDFWTNHDGTFESTYLGFATTWPILFGLFLAAGTLWMVSRSRLQSARFLWLGYSVIIAIHSILFVVLCVLTKPWNSLGFGIRDDVLSTIVILLPTVGLPVLVWLTLRRSRTWYRAAMWLQLGMAATSMFTVGLVTPIVLIFGSPRIGNQLAISASIGLFVMTVVQLLDGERALVRQPHESPLQLSLRGSLLVMSLGGIGLAGILSAFLT